MHRTNKEIVVLLKEDLSESFKQDTKSYQLLKKHVTRTN